MKLNECLGLFLEGQKLKIDFGNVLVSLPRMILDFDCSSFISMKIISPIKNNLF